jgi:uncharacterized protein YkwD
MPASRTITVNRAAVAALVAAMLLTLVPAATMAGAADAPAAVREAEWQVLGAINHYRASRGLPGVRMAQQARVAARERSQDMRDHDYFSHSSPTGKDAASLLAKHNVSYQAGAENIGRITFIDWDTSVAGMMSGWKGSKSHNATMLSDSYNYVGIGIARNDTSAWFTTIFLKQKDHTAPRSGFVQPKDQAAPRSGMVAASTGISVTAREDGKRRVTIRWWGRDPKIASRHSGIDRFVVQHKRVGGKKGWTTIKKNTLSHRMTLTLTQGRHKFRVRAIDNAGNVGKWHRPLLVRVT